jgi:hypothetical protein
MVSSIPMVLFLTFFLYFFVNLGDVINVFRSLGNLIAAFFGF